jgi:predicted TIM-barrel fold metal-dependent hydrolase
MKEQNTRRSFLKNFLTLSAFIAGSVISFKKNRGTKFGKIAPQKAYAMSNADSRVKKIAVEEHYCTQEYARVSREKMRPMMQNMIEQGIMRPLEQAAGDEEFPLTDKQIKEAEYGEGRIKEMDKSGIDMQILSLAAPELDIFDRSSEAIAMAKSINDELSGVVKRYPQRFAGYCCIPLQDPEAAADELERAVTKLGLKGVSVQGDMQGRSFADKKYDVIFERLSKLDVPIYLHSRGPSLWAPDLNGVLDVIRIINSDLLDRYPGLKIILGHGGESVPFWLWRLDGRWRESDNHTGRPKTFSQYFKDNFYVTTSSQCWPTLLQFLIAALGADRILFATDYPYESTIEHVDFIDSAPISDSDREKICHLNAEKLFKL